MSFNWSVYLLTCENNKRTYIGASNNPHRRLRCHNGELVGGAKYTAMHRPWKHVCILTGFDKISALQFEWRVKKHKNSKGKLKTCPGVINRTKNFYSVLNEFQEKYKHLSLTFDWCIPQYKLDECPSYVSQNII